MGKTADGGLIDAWRAARAREPGVARRTAQGMAERARIVLLAAEGVENKDISLRRGAVPKTEGKRRRGREASRGGLDDEPVPARHATSATTRSPRSFAIPLAPPGTERTGACVRWRKPPGFAFDDLSDLEAFDLQPDRTETSQAFDDPLFVEKVRDIVGLPLSPPECALVLCVDEKSQIQALDRSQPLLPTRPDRSSD